MQVRCHPGVTPFLTSSAPALEKDPFSTNVIAVAAARMAASEAPHDERNLWATIEDDDGLVVGLAMHTPPFPLFLSLMPAEAVEVLAQTLINDNRALGGVNGAIDSTAPFARAWETRTGGTSQVVTAMRLYRIGTLIEPASVEGEARIGKGGDQELVARWLADFHDEAQPQAPNDDWAATTRRRIEAAQIHLWEAAGERRAMAAVTAPATRVARVGPVYTPPPHRRNGYGAAVTAAATIAALAAGARHVVLYTDLANPTSNAIYQAIGYQPHHDAEERTLH